VLPLDALPLDPDEAAAEPAADAARDEAPLAEPDPPREAPPPPDSLNARSVVTERGTLGGGTAALGAALRALGTPSR